jgi:hypothetical protein
MLNLERSSTHESESARSESLMRFRFEHERRGDDEGLVVRRLANERLGVAERGCLG